MVEWLPDGVAWRVVQTSLAVLVYALIVNAFYAVISKRRMFARKGDISAERDIEASLQQMEESKDEAAELSDQAKWREDAKVAAADAAAESKRAAEFVEREIRRQLAQGPIWFRELRALVIFPLVGFLFFLLLSANLVFIGSTRPPIEIFSLSMAILLAVRIAAYINESTAHDLAKMLPLALLGFYLVTGTFGGIEAGNLALLELRAQWQTILRFLLLLTLVELVLRVVFLGLRNLRWRRWMRRGRKPRRKSATAEQP